MAEAVTMYPAQQQQKIWEVLLKLKYRAECEGGQVLKIIMDKPMFEATRKLLDYDTFYPPGTGREGQIVRVVNTDREFELIGIQFTQEGERKWLK